MLIFEHAQQKAKSRPAAIFQRSYTNTVLIVCKSKMARIGEAPIKDTTEYIFQE